MLCTAQQMLQDSRTKIELLRMQIIKVGQAKVGEREGKRAKSYYTSNFCLNTEQRFGLESDLHVVFDLNTSDLCLHWYFSLMT